MSVFQPLLAAALFLALTGAAGAAGGPLAPAQPAPFFALRDVSAVLEASQKPDSRWWEPARLRMLLGSAAEGAGLVLHDFGPDPRHPEFAFLAADLGASGPGKTRPRRSAVFLKGSDALPATLVNVELIPANPGGTASACWAATGLGARTGGLGGVVETTAGRLAATGVAFLHQYGHVRPISPRPAPGAALLCWDEPAGEARLLAAVAFTGPRAAAPAFEPVSEIDLAGIRAGSWVVLFQTGASSARSAVFFDARGEGPLRYLITGLAPGVWQIWRNGFLTIPDAVVRPHTGTLYFEAPAGNYFLRALE